MLEDVQCTGAHARAGLAENLETEDLEHALFALLARGANDVAGPKDRLSRRKAIFVKDTRYGTRSSTVVLLSADGLLRFAERNFSAAGAPNGERIHEYAIDC